ncbi:MAG: YybS family protein [Spirochaetales bacterium]|jgi:hypothetical protein|nr:YybS family protein [Spirochaetales bacterium]
MINSGKYSAAGEMLLFSAGAVIFYELSAYFVIFGIPLTVLYRRRGFSAGLYGCGITAAGIAAMKIFRIWTSSVSASVRGELLGIALVVPVSFLIGLVILECPRFGKLRIWQRLVFAVFTAALVYVPLLYLLLTSSELDMMLHAQVDAVLKAVQDNRGGGPGLFPVVSTEDLVRMSREVFLNTFLLGYCCTLSANWVIGVKMAMRMKGETGEFPSYRTFRMPDRAVYVFLVSWAVVFTALFRDLGIIGVAGWNTALLVSFLYMCQGIGIIKVRTEAVPRGFKLIAMVLCFTLVFSAGIVFILGIMAGVSILGVSELWISYRNKLRS